MHFYTLSSGEYSDYNFTIIMHERKFTRQEFISLYNEAVQINNTNDEDVAEIMCDKFRFIVLEDELEINCGYGDFKPVTDEKDINGEHVFISVDEYWDFKSR